MEHTISESRCKCGQRFLIEHDSDLSCRRDRKRIYYPDDDTYGLNAFRCRVCGGVVDETVAGAEYGKRHNS